MPDELFPRVDEDGNLLGSVKRSTAHGDPSQIHPVVHCLVRNGQGDLLLQLRSEDKDIQPGKWDTSMGGHIAFGETVDEALRRELAEELGLDAAQCAPQFLYRYLNRSAVETELVYTFRWVSDGPFKRQASEIDALRFWSEDELEAAVGTGVLTPNLEDELRRLKQAELSAAGTV